MPNWCANSLQLTAASKEEANELYQHLQKQNDDDWTFFGFFVPETWNEDDWYWSRVNNWGTKWDASNLSEDWIDDRTVILTFDTAWSPPIPTYEAMMEQGWSVYASYSEPGMCFAGIWSDGEEEHYEYSNCTTGDEVREVISEELDEEYGISSWYDEYNDEIDSDSGVEHFG